MAMLHIKFLDPHCNIRGLPLRIKRLTIDMELLDLTLQYRHLLLDFKIQLIL